ncbi:hypothetical protein [Vulgatibacter sp.]|uniref:hypothetical protein n=1 Tax=Vulgatibacter sp. TaxID=1971226 RepID=UPI00356961C6
MGTGRANLVRVGMDRESFEPRVRGHLVRVLRAALAGAGGLEAAAARLQQREASNLLTDRIADGDWFPISAFAVMLEELEARVGIAAVEAMAATAASSILPKDYAATSSVERLVATATAAYREVNDRGKLVVDVEEGRAAVRFVGFPSGGGALCRFRAAAIRGVFRVAGAQDASCSEASCIDGGGAFCEFRVRWTPNGRR